MRDLGSVFAGSVFASLMTVSSLFVLDGRFAEKASAQYADMAVNIVSTAAYADKLIHISSVPYYTDKTVYVAGKCKNRGGQMIYLSSVPYWVDEIWYVTTQPVIADMTICLSGDIRRWFELVNQ